MKKLNFVVLVGILSLLLSACASTMMYEPAGVHHVYTTNTQDSHELTGIRVQQTRDVPFVIGLPGDGEKVQMLVEGRLVKQWCPRTDNVNTFIQLPPGRHDVIIQRSIQYTYISRGTDTFRFIVKLNPGQEGILQGQYHRYGDSKTYYSVSLSNFASVQKIREEHTDN
ncbi:MAG TPA: hypothetical protein PK200_07365 [Spirochaetota bacterium]|nr:hypothetical protein [Spirochaetota bacterium]HQO01879.1 hypothetical protein [Spirochaetota bacterium]HQP49142.1 hypothetical protein [Spirochaetota bacterium]